MGRETGNLFGKLTILGLVVTSSYNYIILLSALLSTHVSFVVNVYIEIKPNLLKKS